MNTFMIRVRELLISNKISQKQLSIMSGVLEASLCRYLKGAKPRMDVVDKIAKALGVSPNYLIGKEESID